MTGFVGPYLPTVDKADVCVSYFIASAALLKYISHAYLATFGTSGRFYFISIRPHHNMVTNMSIFYGSPGSSGC